MFRITPTFGLALLLVSPILAAPSPLATSDSIAEHPAVEDAISLLDLWVEEQRQARDLPGISAGVVYGSQLIWSRGWGFSDRGGEGVEPKAADAATVYRIGSVSKLFTATAILQLRDQGKLALEDPVVRHLPWFGLKDPPGEQGPVTLRQLLTHTGGLPREAAFPYWTDHLFPTSEQLRSALGSQPAIYPPATRYKYSNLGMALLGEVVAAVSGESWAEYLRRHIFEPLQMSNSSGAPGEKLLAQRAVPYMRRLADGSRGIFDYYDTGALAPAANVVSTVEDLARFAALHLGQLAAGDEILRSPTAREMQRPHWVGEDWSGGRGLGFSVSHRQGKTLALHGGWIGGNRTLFLLSPKEQLAVIVMINADDGSPSFFGYQIFDQLAAAVAEATAKPAPPQVADPAWQAYVGTYADPWAWQYRVLVRGGQLMLYEHSYPPEATAAGSLSRLQPVAEHTFRLSDGELVVFELDAEGRVERIRRRYDYLYPQNSDPVQSTTAREGSP